MGFFSGRVTFKRFRVNGKGPGTFGSEHLERLDDFAIGKQRVAGLDGIEVGWGAGDHILDTSFDLEKNVVNDTLHFALRLNSSRLPPDLLRAYAQIELKAMAQNNPSGIPSARQKREAREIARERLEEEAKDGRFLKRRAYPILWDAPSNELLVGTTAMTALDRLHTLFDQTFGVGFEPLGSGNQAFRLAETRQQTRGIDDASPSAFVAGKQLTAVAWQPDETSRDFLGNEYLLWLWFMLDAESDTIKLGDGSDVAAMMTRTLILEDPRGISGKESITSDGPTRLPEARRALQSGKLPRKAGLTLVRHDLQYDLALAAESLAVSGAKMPAPESGDDRGRLEERVTQLRTLLETLDLLYDEFVKHRASDDWTKELGRMKRWLQRDER